MGEENHQAKGQRKTTEAEKKASGPFTQSPVCFFLPFLHPSTPKMRIYTLK